MIDGPKLSRRAFAQGLRVRREYGIPPSDALCPFDLAERLGVEVRMVDVPSLEGMYVKGDPPHILLPSDRPPGRQRYGCAHEIGHHVFGHGTRADPAALDGSRVSSRDPEEYMAEVFAGFLLMPKAAVVRGFTDRGWSVDSCTAGQAYTVAGWLGSSYEAFLTHASRVLRLISVGHAAQLRKVTPRAIRRGFLGAASPSDLVVVDEHWTCRSVDVQVGDYVLAPQGTVAEKAFIVSVGSVPQGAVFRASRPGTDRLLLPDREWSSFIRVQRRQYVGRAMFRHLADPDDAA